MTEVAVYTCVVRKVDQEGPGSIELVEKDFHAAHWSSAMGQRIPPGKQPQDPMPIPRRQALELVNRWNRHSAHGPAHEVKYWIK